MLSLIGKSDHHIYVSIIYHFKYSFVNAKTCVFRIQWAYWYRYYTLIPMKYKNKNYSSAIILSRAFI